MEDEIADKGMSRAQSMWNVICGNSTPTDRANTSHLNVVSLIWAACIVVSTWMLVEFDLPVAMQWVVALTPNVAAYFVLRSYLRYLRMTDEMLRRIHVEGLAVGFGVTYVFVIGYMIAEIAGAPDLSLTLLVLVMTAAWLIGNFRALKHYQ